MKQDDQIEKILEKLDNLSTDIKLLRSEVKTTNSELMHLHIRSSTDRDILKTIAIDADDIKTSIRNLEQK